MDHMNRSITISLVLLAACNTQEKESYRALREGNSAYNDSLYVEAIDIYEVSGDPRALHNSAKAEYRLNDAAEAVEKMKSAAEAFTGTPEETHAFHDLGNAYVMRSAWADSMQQVFDREIAAIRMESADITGKVKLAVLRDSLRQRKQEIAALIDPSLEAAVDAYRKALRKAPEAEDTRYNLAFANDRIAQRKKESGNGDKKDDQQLSEKAKELLAKAGELVEQYRFKEALDLLQKGLQQEPSLEKEKEYMQKLETVAQAAEAS